MVFRMLNKQKPTNENVKSAKQWKLKEIEAVEDRW